MKQQERQTKGVFLLLGENEVDKEIFIEKLIKSFSEGKNFENVTIDASEENYIEKFVDAYSTPSLFVPYRVITVKNFGSLSKDERTFFAKVIREFKDEKTLLIFISEFSPYKFDRQISGLIEQVGGQVKVFWKISEQSLNAYVKNLLSKNGIEFSEKLVNLLIERNGRNINAIVEEIKYVRNYYSELEFVSSDDAIELLSFKSGEGNIFDLINAILTKDKHSAILLINQIFDRGEDIFALGSLLYHQIYKLVRLKKLSSKLTSDEEICKTIGISQFELRNLKKFLPIVDDESIKSLLRFLVAVEEFVRISDENLKKVKFENYILEYL